MIIRGGNPPSLVDVEIIDLRKGNKNFGHSIKSILSNMSSFTFLIVKMPEYIPSTKNKFFFLIDVVA